jgi:hypothetical protein
MNTTKTNNKAKLMGEENISKLIIKFAVPTIAAMLVSYYFIRSIIKNI